MNGEEEQEPKKDRKTFILALFGLVGFVIGLMALSFASSYAYQAVVNNTNLAPTFPGISVGTGERIVNTTYNATEARDVWVMAMVESQADIEYDVLINNVNVQDDDVHVSGQGLNRSKTFHVPVNSNYSVNFNTTSVHHYEWREYKYDFVKVK